MKKVLFILLASLFVLGACSNNSSTQSKSVDENKPQFTNDTLVLDQAVLKIKDTFIVNDKESGNKEIAFKYEVKNKTDDDAITPGNVWSAGVEVKQDDDNTVSTLDTGMTIVKGGKYKDWTDHNDDTIKKGKTVKGLSTYQLKNNNEVILTFTKGVGGEKLGTKKIDITKLKTVDYSATDDLNNQASNSDENTNDNTNNDSAIKSDDAVANKTENSNSAMPKKTQVASNQKQSNQQNTTQQNTSMTQADIDEWNKTKPTTHDESQMEQVAQEHSGGHPSAFGKSDVPVGVEKQDNNGQTYIDATEQ
ncbi:DUF5067 domain-containing protein [Staphylococcus sp. NRL 16/872]|uniref:DUF5067 domain-containing protein n=1 Tax=Staphylococcus sp. NRL 16/872 TaxID=2930131 RepID=UPI001FB4A364|nr:MULTISPECIES: DUF5067 domain-containing protein [unclassified Staphylococcus]MCJ1667813.1 DUF5067 domain-containing protein [Staphylococcus sp. NRL 19/737]WEN70304.1 DUF5067 domain-containing protein [Staphylococcus sp. NRL 16/872]